MRFNLHSLAVLIALSSPLGNAATGPLSLKDAILFSTEHSPDLETQRLGHQITELQIKSAKARFLPSLDLTSSHGLQRTYVPPGISDPWASSMNLAVTENLYDNGVTLANYEISVLTRDIALLTYMRAREKLTLDVSTQFYQYSLARQLAEVNKEQLDILRKQLAQVTDHYHQGLSTRTDYLRMANQTKRADIDFRNATIAIRRTEFEIRRLMGLPATETTQFKYLAENELPVNTPSDPPGVEIAYDYRIAKAQTALNPLNVRLAEQKYWPQILLSGSAFYGNTSYINSGSPFSQYQQYGWNVLLGLNYNIFDWGIRRRDVEVARANALIQDNQLQTTRLQVTSDIQNMMLDLTQLQANDHLAQELRQAEEETYHFIRGQYEEGKVQYLDLITSLSNVLDAKIQYLNAHYGLAQTWAKYHYYQGNLYDTVSQ